MIAIIPARGGSKGLPRKNIKTLCGKPLISYTIRAALESKYIEDVYVSTDDLEIAKISKSYGAKVPFMRPQELANDNSKAIDAYLYTMDKLINEFNVNDREFVVLLPTSPLRDSVEINNAVELFYKKQAKTVISVVESEHPVTWYKTVTSDGRLNDFLKGIDNSLNRQEVEKTYLPNGAIYIFDYKALKENYSYYNYETYAYIMQKNKSIDIDTPLDFKIVEILMCEGNKHENISR